MPTAMLLRSSQELCTVESEAVTPDEDSGRDAEAFGCKHPDGAHRGQVGGAR